MWIAGSNNYAIALSSAQAGGTPSGDYFLLNAPSVSINWTYETEIKYTQGRQSYSLKDAKKHWEVTISNCRIRTDVSGSHSAFAELNVIISYLEDWTDQGHDPVFLVISSRAFSTGVYNQLKFRDDSGSSKTYLKGYPTSFQPKIEFKSNYITANITFKECWGSDA